MGDELLRRYAVRVDGGNESKVVDLDAFDDCGCFGWLRGSRERAVSLVLHKKSGSSLSLNYGFIERIEFDPSAGISIIAGRTKVEITGRNLNAEVRTTVRLFEGLTRQRVPWVREANQAELMEVGEEACVVENVRW